MRRWTSSDPDIETCPPVSAWSVEKFREDLTEPRRRPERSHVASSRAGSVCIRVWIEDLDGLRPLHPIKVRGHESVTRVVRDPHRRSADGTARLHGRSGLVEDPVGGDPVAPGTIQPFCT
jgi:hypothetical protein